MPDRWTSAETRASWVPSAAGVSVSRGYLAPPDRVVRWDVPPVSQSWAALQAAARLETGEPGRGITLIDRAEQRRWVTAAELRRSSDRHRGTAGTVPVRRLLERRGDGRTSSWSGWPSGCSGRRASPASC